MKEQDLDNWWENITFKKVSDIFSENYDFAKEVDKDDENAMDDWWRDLSLERKEGVYESNK